MSQLEDQPVFQVQPENAVADKKKLESCIEICYSLYKLLQI